MSNSVFVQAIGYCLILSAVSNVIIMSTHRNACSDSKYVSFGNHCYYINKGHARMNWNWARHICLQLGMQLASIHSAQENSFIVNQLDANVTSPINALIGLYAFDRNSEYKWTDETVFDYTNWAPQGVRTTRAHLNDSACSVMSPITGEWSIDDCHECRLLLQYVCKSDKDTTSSPKPIVQPTASKTNDLCPDKDQMFFKDNCYYFELQNSSVTWAEAKRACASRGMQLASIHSDDENEFIKQQFTKDMDFSRRLWIGLRYDHFGEGFRWVDSTPLDFNKWMVGEPNHGHKKKNEECAEMYWTGEWNDVRCEATNFRAGYICKMVKETSQAYHLTKQEITGTVVGSIILVALIAAGVCVIVNKRHWIMEKLTINSFSSFDNVLYRDSHKNTVNTQNTFEQNKTVTIS